MEVSKKRLDASWKYVIATYIIFGIMVLGICGTASMVFHASPVTMRVLANVCAWSPTIVLFVWFQKWQPEGTIKAFFKRAFSKKLKLQWIIISMLSTGLTFLITAKIYAGIKGVSFTTIFELGGYSIGASIVFSLLSGPTGEECGWRGYLRHEFASKYGFIKGNFLVGLVWTFWHGVLWMVDSDYTSGMEMLIYILSNIVVITAIHLIMAVILEAEDNLIYAVLIHLFFNLPYCFLNADIRFYVIMMVIYSIEAATFLGYRHWRKNVKVSGAEGNVEI